MRISIFISAWYDRDTIIEGSVYSGKDRHNSEIISFYLGAILNFRWTPIAVGRHFDLKELYDKADTDLKNTFLVKGNVIEKEDFNYQRIFRSRLNAFSF